jgi:hypothetical protein
MAFNSSPRIPSPLASPRQRPWSVLANTEIHREMLEENLTAALGLAAHFGEAYRRADATERRWFNQAVVETIGVDVPGEISNAVWPSPSRLSLTTVLLAFSSRKSKTAAQLRTAV